MENNHHRAVIDQEFVGAGQKEGLEIWRIDHFKVTRIPEKFHGQFFSGDSYLVLSTKGHGGHFNWNIHYWLGHDSSMDEMATAAIKAIELDDYLGGRPVQYREVQNHESKLFHSYFKHGIRYFQGGVSSGFHHASDSVKHEKKLYMVKGKKDVRVIQVPFSASSLNKSDVFILEDGSKIYQLNPPGSNHIERIKANVYARNIRDEEHGGKAELIVLEDDWDKNREFWSHFDCSPHDLDENQEIEDREFEMSLREAQVSVFRVSDSKSQAPVIQRVEVPALRKTLLDSNDCFIVDTGFHGIYSWIGRKCTKNEKIACLYAAKELMVKSNYPKHIPFSQVIDGGETTVFKALFSDWRE